MKNFHYNLDNSKKITFANHGTFIACFSFIKVFFPQIWFGILINIASHKNSQLNTNLVFQDENHINIYFCEYKKLSSLNVGSFVLILQITIRKTNIHYQYWKLKPSQINSIMFFSINIYSFYRKLETCLIYKTDGIKF